MKLFKGLFTGSLAGLVMAGCASAPDYEIAEVSAVTETAPMPNRGDAADDPAIWVHPGDSARSRILGTNKDQGLYVYDLEGEILQELLIGQINNVDLRRSAGLETEGFDLAVASNDSVNAVSLFSIRRTDGEVAHIGDIETGKVEPYGICMGTPGGDTLVGITYKDGTVQIMRLAMREGAISAGLFRIEAVASQPEGCVFDEAHDALYVGEEARGIWRLDLADESSGFRAVDMVSSRRGLSVDVEGLTIWRGAEGEGWLVASSQGRSQFVVYDRAPPNAWRGVFRVVEAPGKPDLDAVSHTDGLDATSAALPGYDRGLLVVQDDGNPRPEVDQNFKLLDWADVEAALSLPEIAAE
ncbi:MAG: phytase [Alphaproteobacteria bacterium]|jgi:3-phytase|nr:phytase [Alphaproteobacteria bacterium]